MLGKGNLCLYGKLNSIVGNYYPFIAILNMLYILMRGNGKMKRIKKRGHCC